ncbi:DNA repair protein RecN [Chitinivibrio alkaliphilus]|uniref:DNA repair protein RecN n=1 Tax=Chitinivibrio alkaliphilus ACht1 TaxID=1313304 RepID=U7D6A4_9BACT|nr:DNA repair protein RecN [Chitinivibrio alkaliphilus]ERP31468.1 DNA repair protein RecN [Chitinivibrio alkaliphilus ACht1]
MLRSLQVKNLALIQNISIELTGGFSVFTGETGAGKSILMGAIDLLLGGRASSTSVRSGEEKAEVTGVFFLPQASRDIGVLLEREEIPLDEGELLIRRIIRKNGRNRVLINAVEVPLHTLKQLGNLLFDLHGQHDHQALLAEDAAVRIIDRFSRVVPCTQTYATAWKEYSRARAAVDEHRRTIALLEEKKEFLQFKYEEIEKLSLQDGELDALKDEYQRVSSVHERSAAAGRIEKIISDSPDGQGISSLIGELEHAMRDLCRYDASFSQWLDSIGDTLSVYNDLSATISSYVHDIHDDCSPYRTDELNSRISAIQRLMKKHKCDYPGLLEKRHALAEELASIENAQSDETELKKALEKSRAVLCQHGKTLDAARRATSTELDAGITEKMAFLGFAGGAFKTVFTTHEHPQETGIATPRFLVRTNKGEPFTELSHTASGGEISRIMLAIKSILAEDDPVPILVFDEIDTGVGGKIAVGIGREMRSLSRSHQLFVISHLQQIAVQADSHYSVYKREQDGRIITEITRLSPEGRVEEVARMLGDDHSAQSLEHARTLLAAAESA